MDVRKIELKDNKALEIYLIKESGAEPLGDFTFPKHTPFLFIDDKVFGRLCDIMTPDFLFEWGYNGQEMWVAEINELDFLDPQKDEIIKYFHNYKKGDKQRGENRRQN